MIPYGGDMTPEWYDSIKLTIQEGPPTQEKVVYKDVDNPTYEELLEELERACTLEAYELLSTHKKIKWDGNILQERD
jgi:hypothetical protein